MNGLDLLAKLRTRKTRPRVVVMTSDDAPETLLKAVREQAFRYVHKPVEPPALLQTVRDALEAPDAAADRSDLGAARMGRAGRAVHARGRRAASKRSWRSSTPTSRRRCASRSPTRFASCC